MTATKYQLPSLTTPADYRTRAVLKPLHHDDVTRRYVIAPDGYIPNSVIRRLLLSRRRRQNDLDERRQVDPWRLQRANLVERNAPSGESSSPVPSDEDGDNYRSQRKKLQRRIHGALHGSTQSSRVRFEDESHDDEDDDGDVKTRKDTSNGLVSDVKARLTVNEYSNAEDNTLTSRRQDQSSTSVNSHNGSHPNTKADVTSDPNEAESVDEVVRLSSSVSTKGNDKGTGIELVIRLLSVPPLATLGFDNTSTEMTSLDDKPQLEASPQSDSNPFVTDSTAGNQECHDTLEAKVAKQPGRRKHSTASEKGKDIERLLKQPEASPISLRLPSPDLPVSNWLDLDGDSEGIAVAAAPERSLPVETENNSDVIKRPEQQREPNDTTSPDTQWVVDQLDIAEPNQSDVIVINTSKHDRNSTSQATKSTDYQSRLTADHRKFHVPQVYRRNLRGRALLPDNPAMYMMYKKRQCILSASAAALLQTCQA